MRIIFVTLVFASYLFSLTTNNINNMSIIELFNKKYYTYLCQKRWQYINEYINKREDLLSIVAYACLKKGFLVPALDLAKVLNSTREGRKNATYIATLFLMKKLILQVMYDNMDVSSIKIPEITDNDLGVVFSYIRQKKYTLRKHKIIIKTGTLTYKVWANKDYNIVIEIYKNNDLIKREIYW